MSSVPQADWIPVDAFCAPEGFETSAATAKAPNSFATEASLASSRPLTATIAPSAENARATASPMPAVEPDTSTRLPENEMFMKSKIMELFAKPL
jgi:hypothetical protein